MYWTVPEEPRTNVVRSECATIQVFGTFRAATLTVSVPVPVDSHRVPIEGLSKPMGAGARPVMEYALCLRWLASIQERPAKVILMPLLVGSAESSMVRLTS